MKKTKLEHSGPEVFADELKMVWKKALSVCQGHGSLSDLVAYRTEKPRLFPF